MILHCSLIKIQKSLDGVCIEEAVIPRKGQVHTLQMLKPGVKIDSKTVHVEPLILFTRLTAIIQRDGKVEENFRYELTPEPTTLFRDGMMRKSGKSVLRNHLLQKFPSSECPSSESCVVDGGALLHKVKWTSGSSFKDLLQSYIGYIQKRFSTSHSTVIVVFDGYNHAMSIKASEHKRRTSQVTASDIVFKDEMTPTTTREVFLRNAKNKDKFIKALSKRLREIGVITYQSDGDADTLIVQKALDEAAHSTVDVVAEDTDILVLLIHHCNDTRQDIFFNTEIRRKFSKLIKWWNIRHFKEGNLSKWIDMILFAHAWGGCDTTSAMHRKGK